MVSFAFGYNPACFIYPNFQVYHPNIDLEGNVCLNILREDWKPVLNINTIIYGLYHLFTVMPSVFMIIILWFYSHLIFESFNFVCRNQIARIPSIMMLLQYWGIIQRCLNLMWEGLCLVVMWGKPFSHDVSSFCKVAESANARCYLSFLGLCNLSANYLLSSPLIFSVVLRELFPKRPTSWNSIYVLL